MPLTALEYVMHAYVYVASEKWKPGFRIYLKYIKSFFTRFIHNLFIFYFSISTHEVCLKLLKNV